jgi:CRISPR-associated exonuclease Cas4
MNINMWISLIVSAIALLRFAGWKLKLRFVDAERKWLPKELRDAELAYSEHVFRSGGDEPIAAKCDRAYRTKKGIIVLVELKTRKINRFYLSDVIELSAQRLAIQMQSEQTVADYGYVLVQRPGRGAKSLHRVELLSIAEVVALAERRTAILKGEVSAQYACSKRLCKKCAFLNECNSDVEYLPVVVTV